MITLPLHISVAKSRADMYQVGDQLRLSVMDGVSRLYEIVERKPRGRQIDLKLTLADRTPIHTP